MASYRIYCLDWTGSISLADWIEADSDSQAVAIARTMTKRAQKCEVWEGRRLVASIGETELRKTA